MPMKWVEPDLFLTHLGIHIYHAYKSNNYNDQLKYWYTTDLCEDDTYEFDMREFKIPSGISIKDPKIVIRYLIEEKLLKLPDSQKYTH